MKASLEVSLEHPVMFLSDPYADVDAPLDVAERGVSATESCIAFRVKPYFDGGAKVTISSQSHPSGESPDFEASIKTESGVIGLSDSRRFNYFMFQIDGLKVDIRVWIGVDESLWIRAFEIIEY